MKRVLEAELPPFEAQLIGDLRWLGAEDGTVRLGASGQAHLRWVRERHLERIRSKFHELLGHEVGVELVDMEPAKDGASRHGVQEKGRRNPSLKLDSILDIPEAVEGLAALRMVLSEGWQRWNPLFFHGPSGTGKTLFLATLRHHLSRKGLAVVFTTGDDFSHRYFTSIREGRVASFMDEMKRADAFVMDDVHRLRGRDRTLDAFRQIFDAIYDRGGFLAFSSHEYPLVEGFPEEVSSRLAWGLVIRLDRLGRSSRALLLRRKFAEYGIDGADELIMELADLLPGDGRVIEGVVRRVAYLRRLGMDDRRTIAKEIGEQIRRFKTSFEPQEIIDVVTRYFGLERGALLRDTKARHISRPRALAMYLIRKLTDASYSQIGELFGGRAHTTVMQTCRRVEREMGADPRTRVDIESIERLLEERS